MSLRVLPANDEQEKPFKAAQSDLRRINSSPLTTVFNEQMLVKVVFPSLQCTKVFRLNPTNVSYEPFVKILTIAKVDEEVKRGFRLFTSNGQEIRPGDSLLDCNFKEKDTLLFKHYEEESILRRKSSIFQLGERKLSASTGELRPFTPTHVNATPASSVDYWASVSTFIGSFLKKRPTMNELPKHVLDLLDVPIAPQSHVVVACIAYLRDREAHMLEGLFRLSGLATEVRTVCESFKQATFDLDWITNPHTVATALKQYCRMTCIIPMGVCAPWANLMKESRGESEILAGIVAGITSLPAENKFMLSCLLSFMKCVMDNQEISKMAPHNMSVVWGPNLIQFQLPEVDAFSEANIQSTIMYIILTHLGDLQLWNCFFIVSNFNRHLLYAFATLSASSAQNSFG